MKATIAFALVAVAIWLTTSTGTSNKTAVPTPPSGITVTGKLPVKIVAGIAKASEGKEWEAAKAGIPMKK